MVRRQADLADEFAGVAGEADDVDLGHAGLVCCADLVGEVGAHGFELGAEALELGAEFGEAAGVVVHVSMIAQRYAYR